MCIIEKRDPQGSNKNEPHDKVHMQVSLISNSAGDLFGNPLLQNRTPSLNVKYNKVRLSRKLVGFRSCTDQTLKVCNKVSIKSPWTVV